MIFYFSGTGNSQFAAKQLASELGDELVSVNQCLKKNEKRSFQSKRPLVFIAPHLRLANAESFRKMDS